LAIRADRGEKLAGEVTFLGRVDCQGQGWHLQADRVTVLLGSGNDVKTIIAKGAVSLSGKMGEGKGGYLELDLMNRVARWQGRVKGSAEVLP
jgi:lipopolysaccharide export system protein LptA